MPTARQSNAFSLVADIGGTNTRVALAEGTRLLVRTVKRYQNVEHSSLEAVLRRFLHDEGDVDCAGACVAVAGPVNEGVATLTNVNWRIDTGMLARASRAETVALLNDLQAQGHSLGRIRKTDLFEVIKAGRHCPTNARLVIGIGTGFNIAPVHCAGTRHMVLPSEAGHASLPVQSEEDLRLFHFLRQTRGFPDIEEALSGRGLENIYAWLGQEAGEPQTSTSTDIIAGFEAGTDVRAAEAMRTFTGLLGTAVGNFALDHLPYGGIYLAGGIARAFAPHLASLGFDEAFRSKGRFTDFMDRFSVTVINDDYAALVGCASHLEEIAP